MYDFVQSSKFLILIKECCNDAQEYIPDYLEDIVEKQIDCLYSMEAPINRNPLFNGSSEFKINSYLSYLTGLGYKIKRERENINQIYILKGKKFFLFFDAGSPPRKKNSGSYQSGPLSFEYFIDNHKIITNCGFGKKISKKAELISKLTSAQSTLCLNDSSVTRFERSNLINKIFGSSITSSFKIFDLHLNEDINFTSISATHDAYKNNFGYLHERQIKINKKNGSLSGVDNLTSDKNRHGLTNTYGIRFHLYPGIVAVQTIGKNSILIHIEKNKSLVFTATGENISLEKSIFLGRNQIINNSCITISGILKKNETKNIYWELKKNY